MIRTGSDEHDELEYIIRTGSDEHSILNMPVSKLIFRSHVEINRSE